jgi:hypothetical protein
MSKTTTDMLAIKALVRCEKKLTAIKNKQNKQKDKYSRTPVSKVHPSKTDNKKKKSSQSQPCLPSPQSPNLRVMQSFKIKKTRIRRKKAVRSLTAVFTAATKSTVPGNRRAPRVKPYSPTPHHPQMPT